MKCALFNSRACVGLMGLGVLLVVVARLSAYSDYYPPNEGEKYGTNRICIESPHPCYVGNAGCSNNYLIVVCEDYPYKQVVYQRAWGDCILTTLTNGCYSYTKFYCSRMDFYEFSDCVLAGDCSTFWLRPDACDAGRIGGPSP